MECSRIRSSKERLATCKETIQKYARKYYQKNRTEIRKRNAEHYAKNRKRILAQQKKYQPTRYARSLKSRYRMTLEEYEARLLFQNHECAACRTDLRELKKRHIHVDHCHRSKKVRGILCGPCNIALGVVKEDPNRLRCLADYISLNNGSESIQYGMALVSGDYSGSSAQC